MVDTDFFLWHAEDYAADFQAVTNIAEVITAVALVCSVLLMYMQRIKWGGEERWTKTGRESVGVSVCGA